MRVALAPYGFVNGDLESNLSQLERGLKAAQGRAELACFGESFLQGFDGLNWDYAYDRELAVSADSPVMRRICDMTVRYGTDLLFGYIEEDRGDLYSSCALVQEGKILHNYRRISKGWKERFVTDPRYREGEETGNFSYRGQVFKIALCGDLWEAPERFCTQGVLLWPVYVNFSLEEWAEEEREYAKQAALAAERVLLVNSISREPDSHGGAFDFFRGEVQQRACFDAQELLIVEI